jgi:hypothetical protein
MDKYIGFDIDSNKTVVCVVEKGKKERFETIRTAIPAMKQCLRRQRSFGCKLHLTFEISGQAGFIYDSLIDCVDSITVSNPTKMTWIYRTTKKNDRIDARKQAILLSIGEIPGVHMPTQEVRQWRQTILHRRKIVGKVAQAKNRIRALLKSQGYTKAFDKGSWWKKLNRVWMRSLCEGRFSCKQLWRMQLCNLLEELEVLENQRKRVTEYLDDYLSGKSGAAVLLSIGVTLA